MHCYNPLLLSVVLELLQKKVLLKFKYTDDLPHFEDLWFSFKFKNPSLDSSLPSVGIHIDLFCWVVLTVFLGECYENE